ncbi:MAG: hypothetical protein Q9220_003756 [cf. Caloplaca sp. 1 TL-2023]
MGDNNNQLHESRNAGELPKTSAQNEQPGVKIVNGNEWLRQDDTELDPLKDAAGDTCPTELARLQSACLAGDMTAVRNVFKDWQDMPKGKRVWKQRFASAFSFAQAGGHTEVAEYLIQQGVTPNGAHFLNAQEAKCYAFVELFIKHGFDINNTEVSSPPLFKAITDEETTRWLLDRGANPNVGTHGNTPLSFAVRDAPFHIIQLLFDRGGPDSIRHGILLWFAIARKSEDRLQVLQYLLDIGADRDLNERMFYDRPDLAFYQDCVIGCLTPLCSAAAHGNLEVVKFLVSRGADPSIRASDPTARKAKGRLPIEEAEFKNHHDIVEYLNSLSADKATPDAVSPVKGRGESRL